VAACHPVAEPCACEFADHCFLLEIWCWLISEGAPRWFRMVPSSARSGDVAKSAKSWLVENPNTALGSGSPSHFWRFCVFGTALEEMLA
jgi:hypothetical protein